VTPPVPAALKTVDPILSVSFFKIPKEAETVFAPVTLVEIVEFPILSVNVFTLLFILVTESFKV